MCDPERTVGFDSTKTANKPNFCARKSLLDGFRAFSDDDPDRNSVDFIYWYNGDGMVEFQIEMGRHRLTLPKFQKQEAATEKRLKD